MEDNTGNKHQEHSSRGAGGNLNRQDLNFLKFLFTEKPYEYKFKKYKVRKVPHETMNYEIDDQTRFRNTTMFARNDNAVLQSLYGSSKNAGLKNYLKKKQAEKEIKSNFSKVLDKKEVNKVLAEVKYPFDVVDWENNIVYDLDKVQTSNDNETITEEFVNTILEQDWEKYIVYDPEIQKANKNYMTIYLEDPNLIFEKVEEKKQSRLKKRQKEQFSGDKPLKNKYNISNDKYYNQEQKTKSSLGTFGVQHSLPALKLDPRFYKTNHTREELRNFHRPSFKLPHRIQIEFKKPLLAESNSSNIIKKTSELTLKDTSEFAIFEYSEEYPLFIVNTGMVSLLNTYYRKSNQRDDYASDQNNLTVLDLDDPSPFYGFGDVKPGFTLKAITNNLFCAPIFKHATNDWLCVMSTDSNGNYIILPRKIDNLYCVGQEYPAEEVYAPHSRKLNIFCKNRLKVAAYRLFSLKDRGFKEFRMSQLDEMFPYFSEGSKRKWLKEYADCVKRGKENVWVLKQTSSLLLEEDLRKLVTPENICQYESMLAGERRLEDYGYKCLDDSEEEGEDEKVYSVPWQLSRNFINAANGKGLLELNGPADPTGIGEGFSFRKIKLTKGNEAENRKIISEHQANYKEEIEKIWTKQLNSLSSTSEIPFDDSYFENTKEEKPFDNIITPDESNILIIKRTYGFGDDQRVEIEKITDSNVIKQYLKARKKTKVDEKKTVLKCGSCGEIGHTKTNKLCPNFNTTKKPTKKKIESERKKAKNTFHNILMPLMNEFFVMPYSVAFHRPVSVKKFPDYPTIVSTPMDLSTIKTKIRHNKYTTFSEFFKDVKQIHENCVKYNGPEHSLSKVAENFIKLAQETERVNKSKIEEAENIFCEYLLDESNL
ncbi:Putative transcription initiation factor TFIID 111 kDa subunit [Nosema bombycis CQ1]|uniref:Putative transcription initiation factor TFIID 111 kDa subunit n=1 Tax=Nosema bombycis (strain CQ1 / CVCC 102059) TaxID=578461 RepID=R0MIV1_NOSB1|nr:Putative transcription initiation factor TFIID 111 kDa subunit [Nosema bombycis CQ1]|eukprot:EOB12728.1 Putative transcription initiation factor TFIID 111 kDa subunit [Nosema bombycis CQ1]